MLPSTFRRLDPVALLLFLGLMLEILGVYPAFVDYRANSILGGAICIGLCFLFVGDPVQFCVRALRVLPTVPALLYLLWTGILCCLSPYPVFGRAETLRVFCGVLAYLLIVGNRRVAQTLVPMLVIGAVVVAGYDFAHVGVGGGVRAGGNNSAFATHQELGSLLMITLPWCLLIAINAEGDGAGRDENQTFLVRIGGSGAGLFLLLALLIARCRSAWVGEMVAFVVGTVAIFWYRQVNGKTKVRNRIASNWLVTALVPLFAVTSFVVFLVITQSSQVLTTRLSTIANWRDDLAMRDRFLYWKAGLAMARERPWTGWGPGSFQVLQNNWTGIGTSQVDVLRVGSNHSNVAHNYYAQWMADTGFTGLALHVGLLISMGVAVCRRIVFLRRKNQSWQKTSPLIIGGATVLGTCVDAISSPSYNFHVISLLWWMLLGIVASMTVDSDH